MGSCPRSSVEVWWHLYMPLLIKGLDWAHGIGKLLDSLPVNSLSIWIIYNSFGYSWVGMIHHSLLVPSCWWSLIGQFDSFTRVDLVPLDRFVTISYLIGARLFRAKLGHNCSWDWYGIRGNPHFLFASNVRQLFCHGMIIEVCFFLALNLFHFLLPYRR